jgi:hypothetical protein
MPVMGQHFRLVVRSLPDYEQSFQVMEGLRRTATHPTATFEELSLSFVRTVCVLARRDHKGVLWGNDVYPDL